MGRPRTEDTTTFSLRIPNSLLALIEQSATHHGQTRTQYILSWLPENHTRAATKSQEAANGNPR